MLRKSVLIIGAGRFGLSVAKTLYSLGHEVMVADKDANLIQAVQRGCYNCCYCEHNF